MWSTEQGFRKEKGGTRITPGVPDLIVMFPSYPGCWTFAELKAPKDEGGRGLTASQVVFMEACQATRVPWELWRSAADAYDWCVRVGIIKPA